MRDSDWGIIQVAGELASSPGISQHSKHLDFSVYRNPIKCRPYHVLVKSPSVTAISIFPPFSFANRDRSFLLMALFSLWTACKDYPRQWYRSDENSTPSWFIRGPDSSTVCCNPKVNKTPYESDSCQLKRFKLFGPEIEVSLEKHSISCTFIWPRLVSLLTEPSFGCFPSVW